VYALNAAYNSRDYAHDRHCTHDMRNLTISIHRGPYEEKTPPESGPGIHPLLMFSDNYCIPGMRKVRCRIDYIDLRESNAGIPYLAIHIDLNSYSDLNCPYRLIQRDYIGFEIKIGLIDEDRIKLRGELTE